MSPRSLVLSLAAALGLLAVVIFFVLRSTTENGTHDPDRQVPPTPSAATDTIDQTVATPTRPHDDPSAVVVASQDRGDSTAASSRDESALEPLPDPLASGALVVLVENSEGSPLVDRTVSITSGRSVRSEATNEEGAATFVELAAGRYDIFVTDGSHKLQAERSVTLRQEEEREVLYVWREASREVSGLITDNVGTPLSKISLSISPLRRTADETFLLAASSKRQVTTDGEGAFTFTGLPEGNYEIVVAATREFGVKRQNAMAPAEGVELVLFRTRQLTLEGRVITPEGDGIEGAWITVAGRRERQSTDDVGDFSFTLDVDIDFSKTLGLLVRKDGFRASEERLRYEDIQDLDVVEMEIQLDPIADFASLRGRILNSHGRPVPDESVFLRSPELKLRYYGRSDETGHFEIENIPAGEDYRLWIYPTSDYLDKIIHPVKIEVGDNDLEVILESLDLGEVRGTLVDVNGAPVPSFTFRVKSMQARGQFVDVTSDANGEFLVEDVPSGNLMFDTLSAPRLTVRGARLNPDDALDIRIPIGFGTGALEGLVLSADRRPVRGAKVAVEWSHREAPLTCRLTFEATTDARGQFDVEDVGHGSYRVLISAPGFQQFKETLEIEEGESKKDMTFMLSTRNE